jgi:hypothetical protein
VCLWCERIRGRKREEGREEERGSVGEWRKAVGGMRRNWGPSRPAGTKHTAAVPQTIFYF